MTGPDLPAWKAGNFWYNYALAAVGGRPVWRPARPAECELAARRAPVSVPVAARRQLTFARVAELADALDSKSSAR